MGLDRIATAFAIARAEGRAALMPYFTLGYPDADTSEAVIRAIAAAGADLIELGVPFSDPLADGPTIQRSTQVALEARHDGRPLPGADRPSPRKPACHRRCS